MITDKSSTEDLVEISNILDTNLSYNYVKMPFQKVNIIKIEDINKKRYKYSNSSKFRKKSTTRNNSEFSSYVDCHRRSIIAPAM